MALVRPLKEGNVRTYQEKVGLGYTDILASEADADSDTMYAAWNGTLGGDLTGTLPNPTVTAAAKSKWTDTGTDLTAITNRTIVVNTTTRIGGSADVSEVVHQGDATHGWTLYRGTGAGGGTQHEFWQSAPGASPVYNRNMWLGTDGLLRASLAPAQVTKGMMAIQSVVRTLTGMAIPTNWTIPSKNAWNTFASVSATTQGGYMFIIVDPSWEVAMTTQPNHGVTVRVMAGATQVYARYTTPTMPQYVPFPGFTVLSGMSPATYTFSVDLFCETNNVVRSPPGGSPGAIWIVEMC
jgi:hypothetical protein